MVVVFPQKATNRRTYGRGPLPDVSIIVDCSSGGAVAQLGARLDGIEEVVGSNPIGSTNFAFLFQLITTISGGR
jgi:hypothetical protein